MTEQTTLSPELEERFAGLDRRVSILESRLDSMLKHLENLERATLGETEAMRDYDRVPVATEVDELREELTEIQADAEMAVSIAARGDAATDGGPTKAQIARRLSRDEVIRATADGKGAGSRDLKSGERDDVVGSVTVSDVKDMAKPQTQLKWKTVAEDAWKDLVEEWPCFRIESPDDGSKRLTVDADAIPADLARVVERSLDRDDIANSVVGGRSSGGA